jgi:hypothetical protein
MVVFSRIQYFLSFIVSKKKVEGDDGEKLTFFCLPSPKSILYQTA